MTDKKDDAGKAPGAGAMAGSQGGAQGSQGPQGKPADPKRPHATLDLKAVEVTTKPVQAAKPEPTKPEPAKTDSKTSAPSQVQPAKPDAPGAAKPADTKAKPVPAAAPAQLARSGAGIGSTFTHLVAGLVGGAMAWYGAQTLGPQLGLPLPVDTKATETLAGKLAALEKSLADRSAASNGDVVGKLAAAQAQLAKLEAATKPFADLGAAQARLAAENKALADKLAEQSGSDGPAARLAKLEERLKLMSEAAGDPQAGKLPQVAALSGRIVDLETTLTAQLSALRNTVTQQVEQRLAVTNETSEAAKSGTNRVDRELAAVKSDAAATGQKLDTLRSDADRMASAVQGIRDDTNGFKNAIDALKSDVEGKFKATAKPADVASAIAPVAGQLSALEQNLKMVVKSEEERKTNAERILLALELNNLKRVLDRGQKYAGELAEVTKAAAGKVDLTVLERYKDTGIATIADLTRDFRPVASAVLDADADTGDGSVVDRMIAGAKSVIRVRKVNHAPDDKSAEAVVGRMEAALKENRLAEVLAESKLIPAKAQNAAHDWLVKIEARAAVDRAIASLESALKTSLAGGPPPAPAAAPK